MIPAALARYGYAKEVGGCLLWYGPATLKRIPVRRIAFEAVGGAVPAGRNVMVDCDDPRCVRHLRLAAAVTRAYKLTLERRMTHAPQHPARGERHGRAKLSEANVRDIRQQRAGGASARELAEVYRVTRAAIYVIVTRRTWRHIVE